MKLLLPYASLDHFVLFSIDKHTSRVYVFDPLTVSPLLETQMRRAHSLEMKLLRTSFYLNEALALAQPGWEDDIFEWRSKSLPVQVPKSPDR